MALRTFCLRYGLACAVAAALSAVNAEVLDIQWNSAGEVEQSFTVPSGKFTELCGPLSKGQSIAWTFKADQPLNFNIHYHVGKDVTFPEKQDDLAESRGNLNVPVEQQYCWMWSNKQSASARLQVTLKR